VKICGYRIEQYVMKLSRPVADANLPGGVDLMPACLLYLDTDEGISGLSLGWGGPAVGTLFRALEGRHPGDVVALWSVMNDWVHKGGNEGEANLALSSLDIALWDLKAKIAGQPLWRLLGAREGRVKVYASGLDYSLSDEELFSFYQRMAQRGITAGKLKVGLDLAADLRRLNIMREALSAATSQPELMIDANEYWSPKQAVRYIRRIEEQIALSCVEEPARRWDYDGLSLVSRQVRADVATGENLNSVADFYPLITQGAVDVVNVSQIHSGITGCRQVANLARLYGLPVSMTNSTANFMGHLAAAVPNHTTLEYLDCGREQCLLFSHHIDGGYLVLGSEPGLGIEVDVDRLRELQAHPPKGKARFPFPRRAGAGRYLVPPAADEVSWSLD